MDRHGRHLQGIRPERRTMKSILKKLYSDEQGADMVEYVLIVAAVALPLLGIIIWFWKDISMWLGEAWTTIRGGSGDMDPTTVSH
jgi:Flp pilus assembly pilin Flp